MMQAGTIITIIVCVTLLVAAAAVRLDDKASVPVWIARIWLLGWAAFGAGASGELVNVKASIQQLRGIIPITPPVDRPRESSTPARLL